MTRCLYKNHGSRIGEKLVKQLHSFSKKPLFTLVCTLFVHYELMCWDENSVHVQLTGKCFWLHICTLNVPFWYLAHLNHIRKMFIFTHHRCQEFMLYRARSRKPRWLTECDTNIHASAFSEQVLAAKLQRYCNLTTALALLVFVLKPHRNKRTCAEWKHIDD